MDPHTDAYPGGNMLTCNCCGEPVDQPGDPCACGVGVCTTKPGRHDACDYTYRRLVKPEVHPRQALANDLAAARTADLRGE